MNLAREIVATASMSVISFRDHGEPFYDYGITVNVFGIYNVSKQYFQLVYGAVFTPADGGLTVDLTGTTTDPGVTLTYG